MEQQDFQSRVLQELMQQEPSSKKAARSELAAILGCMAQVERDGTKTAVVLRSQRSEAWNKCFTLIQKTFNITVELGSIGDHLQKTDDFLPGRERTYAFYGESAKRMMTLMQLPERFEADEKCVRGFLAGQFLCVGSIRDPQKEYYLSWEILNEPQAQQIARLLANAGAVLRRTEHGRGHALVTRDSGVIVDILSLLGAHVCMMDMENARIMKQVRGRINRKVNCETANIMKTVAASQKQMEQIRMIRESSIWETLPESLQQMALLREKYPESSLQELGAMLEPPVGKSGVNHRLRRLAALAEELQERSTDSQERKLRISEE